MKIKFWGARGSFPSPGPRTVRYGGNTTCVEVLFRDGTLIIIDAGTGIRNLGKDLLGHQKSGEIYLILTHTHLDHIQGFPFFQPAYFPDWTIHFHGCPSATRKIKQIVADQMEGAYFPVNLDDLKAMINFIDLQEEYVTVGKNRIRLIRTNHPLMCNGMRFEEDGKSFAFITDNELDAKIELTSWQALVDFSKGADLFVHDAHFTPDEIEAHRGWGHSSYTRALDLAKDAGAGRVGLFHHDPDRSDEQLDEIVADSKSRIESAGGNFECFAVREGLKIEL